METSAAKRAEAGQRATSSGAVAHSSNPIDQNSQLLVFPSKVEMKTSLPQQRSRALSNSSLDSVNASRPDRSFVDIKQKPKVPVREEQSLLLAYCNMMISQRHKVYRGALEYFGTYENKLDPRLKIELGLFGVTIGAGGFIVFTFGLINALFILLFMCGILLLIILSYQKIRKDGIISYLPGALKRVLLSWSLFDFLCEIFIVRNNFRLFSNIIAPFLECETKNRAKANLHRLKNQGSITPELYKVIFKKGILNNIPAKYRALIVPEDERDLKKLQKIQRVIDKLDRDFDMKTIAKGARRSRDSLDEDSSSRLSGIAKPAAVIASQERNSSKRLFESMSMGPIKKKDIDDVRIENVKKRMQIEALNRKQSESELENNGDPIAQVIEENYQKAQLLRSAEPQRRRKQSDDESSLISIEEEQKIISRKEALGFKRELEVKIAEEEEEEVQSVASSLIEPPHIPKQHQPDSEEEGDESSAPFSKQQSLEDVIDNTVAPDNPFNIGRLTISSLLRPSSRDNFFNAFFKSVYHRDSWVHYALTYPVPDITYRNLQHVMALLFVGLMVQLKASKETRQWAISIAPKGGLIATILGMSGISIIALIKFLIDRSREAREKEDKRLKEIASEMKKKNREMLHKLNNQ
ncbi:hypothetical protein FGO68_gene2832 [Halteria grandinella]|uniref:Uncharacterized protein n=1 Tax=Halteria grandinella TaxID=5974 RepID=A0A8J8NVW2_HALGN|nr:hypothetical protein FGO68_gene2832 [Halteria grandinella]